MESRTAISASTSRSITSNVNGSHNFVIEGYSLVKGMDTERRISSETFFVGGYQWAMSKRKIAVDGEEEQLQQATEQIIRRTS